MSGGTGTVTVAGKVTNSLDIYKLKLMELQDKEHFETKRGELYTYKFFEDILGLDRKDTRFRSVMDHFRKFMLENHGIDFLAVTNDGYRILEPGEQVKHAACRVRSGLRKIRKGRQSAESAIATGQLTSHEKTAADFLIVVASNTASQLLDASRMANKNATAPKVIPPPRH